MTKATDRCVIIHKEGHVLTQIPYDSYIVIGDNEGVDSPNIHINADPILIAKAYIMLSIEYKQAMEKLSEEDKAYIAAVIDKDANKVKEDSK